MAAWVNNFTSFFLWPLSFPLRFTHKNGGYGGIWTHTTYALNVLPLPIGLHTQQKVGNSHDVWFEQTLPNWYAFIKLASSSTVRPIVQFPCDRRSSSSAYREEIPHCRFMQFLVIQLQLRVVGNHTALFRRTQSLRLMDVVAWFVYQNGGRGRIWTGNSAVRRRCDPNFTNGPLSKKVAHILHVNVFQLSQPHLTFAPI